MLLDKSKSKSKQKFSIDGNSYHAFPTIDQFLEESGLSNANLLRKISLLFEKHAIEDVSQLYSYAVRDLITLGIGKKYAVLLSKHLQRLRRRSPLVLSPDELKIQADQYIYLTTANSMLDGLLTHANGRSGLRSKTLVEFYGEAGIGKTQLMMTLAVMCMRSTPGWSKPVYYIDTEGAFDLFRLYQVAQLHGVEQSVIDHNLRVARAYSFDDVEQILVEIGITARTEDIGMIILDSIIDPLKAQYPLDEELTNLQERQQHLKQVTDQLKSLAQVHNLIAVITNQVRSAMDDNHPDKIVPQGGNVLAHATDMRFWMKSSSQPQLTGYTLEQIETSGMQLINCELVDCGFLSPGTADIMVGRMGAADPTYWKMFADTDMKADDLTELMEELYE